jgi:hypothetical protein
MLILEHFADNDEERELSSMGFFLWGNANNAYNEAAMGYNSDLSWGSNYNARSWTNAHLISYMESHDEERLMYKNTMFGNVKGSYSTKETKTALKRMEMACNVFFTVPGPKMVWQFGELGYDVNIDFNGRTGEKPIRWEYLKDKDRAHLRWVYSTFMNLRNTYPVFHTTLNADDGFGAELNGVVKKTWLQKGDHKIHALSNTNVDQTNTTVFLQGAGTWYELFSGDSFTAANSSFAITMAPGEYRLYSNKKMEIAPFIFKEEQNNTLALGKSGISIFPNPASTTLQITGVNLSKNTLIRIYDLSGRLRLQESLSSEALNIEMLQSGMYVIEVQSNDIRDTQRLVVSK